jgi:hypothetical protein
MKQYFFGALITLATLLAPASSALAQSGSSVVHIQQEFVVAGKTLPAGTYRVSHEGGANQILRLRGLEPGTSVFLIPLTTDAAANGASATLTQVDDTYYLTEIATDTGVYRLSAPVRSAHAKKHTDSTSTAGAN